MAGLRKALSAGVGQPCALLPAGRGRLSVELGLGPRLKGVSMPMAMATAPWGGL